MLYDLTDVQQCAALVVSARPRKASQEAMLEVIRRVGRYAPTPSRDDVVSAIKNIATNPINTQTEPLK